MPAQQPEVYVVGSVNADLVVTVPRRPGPGETVPGSDVVTLPGGKGANQAVAAARLGGTVGMLARVGDDPVGGRMVENLRAAGVDVTDVQAVPGVPTGVALVTLTPDGENSIVVSPGANARCGPDAVAGVAARLAASRVVVLQRELPEETVTAAATTAREAGTRVVLNAAPSGAVDPAVLAAADPLVVNGPEAADLLGEPAGEAPDGVDAALDAAARLRGRGPVSVVVTLGAAGAVHVSAAGAGHEPAPTVPVVDTTGAGDAFVGALAVLLARGAGLGRAVRSAVVAGAHAVRATGAQSSFPGPEVLGAGPDVPDPEVPDR